MDDLKQSKKILRNRRNWEGGRGKAVDFCAPRERNDNVYEDGAK
jgi:hypothetical protein